MTSSGRILALIGALFVFTPVVSATPHKVVAVNSVDALYNAVNDPSNHDAEIRVTGGRTYLLSPLRQLPNGKTVARPKEGRLVLQRGMTLVGANTYLLVRGRPAPRDVSGEMFADPASETILDGSALLGSASGGEAGTAAVVQIGRDNAVRRLTIRSNEEATAAIIVNQLDRLGMSAEVTDCTLEGGSSGGRRGVMIDVSETDLSGTSTTVTLERNVIRHHRAGEFGFGVQAIRAFTSGGTVSVGLKDNVFYDNEYGLFVVNFRASGTTAEVVSKNNIYRSNGGGMLIYGGRDAGFVRGSLDNVVTLTSTGDEITNNRYSGVTALAALRDGADAPGNSDNQVSLTFTSTQFIGATGAQNGWGIPWPDGRADLELYGAVDESGTDQGAGVDNQVKVLLTWLAASPVAGESVYVLYLDTNVPEPSNQVIFVGGVGAIPGNNPKVPVIVDVIVL